MKKRILSLALSLALCLGLAVPVLAVGSEWNLTLPDEEKKTLRSATTFKLRHWEVTDSEEDRTRTFTGFNEEIEDYTVGVIYCPEAGDTFTLTTRNGQDIRISAWSDPDGDGVYDQRLGKITPHYEYVDNTPHEYVNDTPVGVYEDTPHFHTSTALAPVDYTSVSVSEDFEVMPINTTGPLTYSYANVEEEGFYTSMWQLNANGEFCDSCLAGGLLSDESHAEWLDVSIPVNYLLEQLGPNTLLLLLTSWEAGHWSGWAVLLPNSQPVISTQTSTAYASTQNVLVDSSPVEFQCYALKDENGFDTNYIKLRDVASVLNGSGAQFNVGWDGTVNIETGKAYTPNGSEMKTPFSGNRAYEIATAETRINGSPAALDAIVLKDDAGGAYTYYKLRDLGKALGFSVDWSADKGIYIETK